MSKKRQRVINKLVVKQHEIKAATEIFGPPSPDRRRRILQRVAILKRWYFGLNISQRLHFNAVAFLLYALFMQFTPFAEAKAGALYIFFACWVVAILYDLLRVYSLTYETLLGKAAILLIFGLGLNLSITLAAQIINSITGVDPSKFPRALSLLSVLTIPVFITIGLFALQLILVLLMPFAIMFHALPSDEARQFIFPTYRPHSEKYRGITLVTRVVSVVIFATFVHQLSSRAMSGYEAWVSKITRSFIYNLEMYSRAPCPIKPGSKVAFVGDGLVAVGTLRADNISFELQDCK